MNLRETFSEPDEPRVDMTPLAPTRGLSAPSIEVVEKQDPTHTREDFEGDLDRATERVEDSPS